MIIQERAKSKHFSYPLFTFPFSSSEFQWCFKRFSFFSTWSPAADPAKHGESLICKRVTKNRQEKENDKGPSRNKFFVDPLTCDFNCPKLMLLINSKKRSLNSINEAPMISGFAHGNSQNAALGEQ